MDKEILKFFEKLYYDCDLMALTGANCYDYASGQIDIKQVIQAIKDNNLKIKLEYDY